MKNALRMMVIVSGMAASASSFASSEIKIVCTGTILDKTSQRAVINSEVPDSGIVLESDSYVFYAFAENSELWIDLARKGHKEVTSVANATAEIGTQVSLQYSPVSNDEHPEVLASMKCKTI